MALALYPAIPPTPSFHFQRSAFRPGDRLGPRPALAHRQQLGPHLIVVPSVFHELLGLVCAIPTEDHHRASGTGSGAGLRGLRPQWRIGSRRDLDRLAAGEKSHGSLGWGADQGSHLEEPGPGEVFREDYLNRQVKGAPSSKIGHRGSGHRDNPQIRLGSIGRFALRFGRIGLEQSAEHRGRQQGGRHPAAGRAPCRVSGSGGDELMTPCGRATVHDHVWNGIAHRLNEPTKAGSWISQLSGGVNQDASRRAPGNGRKARDASRVLASRPSPSAG